MDFFSFLHLYFCFVFVLFVYNKRTYIRTIRELFSLFIFHEKKIFQLDNELSCFGCFSSMNAVSEGTTRRVLFEHKRSCSSPVNLFYANINQHILSFSMIFRLITKSDSNWQSESDTSFFRKKMISSGFISFLK